MRDGGIDDLWRLRVHVGRGHQEPLTSLWVLHPLLLLRLLVCSRCGHDGHGMVRTSRWVHHARHGSGSTIPTTRLVRVLRNEHTIDGHGARYNALLCHRCGGLEAVRGGCWREQLLCGVIIARDLQSIEMLENPIGVQVHQCHSATRIAALDSRSEIGSISRQVIRVRQSTRG